MDSSWDLRVTSIIRNITKSSLRMRIFLLLYINPELYITEISNKLNKSKATVSRHLNALEEEGVVERREVPDERNIIRKYYSLSKEKLEAILPKDISDEYNSHFSDPAKRLKLYAKFIEIIRSLKLLFSKGFDIVQPLIDAMAKKNGDIEFVDKELVRYAAFLFPHRMIHFKPILVSKARIAEVNALYDEYWSKLRQIREDGKKNNEEGSILIVHSILPIRDILETNAGKFDDE